MKLRLLIVLASLAVLVALPLGRDATRPSAADAASISIVDFAFQPANVTVDLGATVTWVHNGSAPHTTTSETGLWSGTLSAGQSFAFTFNTPGTFSFFCDFHPSMTGTITVTRSTYLPIVLHNAAGSPDEPTPTTTAITLSATPATATAQPATATAQAATETAEAATWTAVALTGTATPIPNAATRTAQAATQTAAIIATVSVEAATQTAAAIATGTVQAMTATVTPSMTPTEESGQLYGLQGHVNVRPRWANITTTGQPVAYEVILDTSGSMIWNFAGQTGSSSNPVQCTGVAWHNACYDGWNPVEERRIYIAKQAISDFIDRMGANDTMRIVSFSGNLNSNFSEQNAISLLTKAWPTTGWSSDKTVLRQAVMSAGAYNNDPYFTRGATPSATGFASGRQVLAGAPPTAPDGQPYRRVVIFLTDGVANVFLDGETNNAQDICPGVPGASEIASCQVGVTSTGRYRPITAVTDQANRMKQDDPNITIYVVVLAGTDTTGLRDVASTPSYLYEASQPDALGPVLDLIQTDVQSATCTPDVGAWINQVDAQHTPEFPAPNNLPPGVFGYVYLYDQNGNPLPAGQHQLPITHDPADGRLAFTLPAGQGLAPGTYQIGAFAGYKGEDTISRRYDGIFDPNLQEVYTARVFTLTGGGLGPVVAVVAMDPLYLDLQSPVCP